MEISGEKSCSVALACVGNRLRETFNVKSWLEDTHTAKVFNNLRPFFENFRLSSRPRFESYNLPEKHLPEIRFSRKALGRNYIVSNAHFLERALPEIQGKNFFLILC